MTHNYPVPAKRYDIFQTAFEKRVAEAQKAIQKLNELQGLYTAAREALIAVNLPNDTTLDMDGSVVTINIKVRDGDTMDTFHPLLDEIGNGLVQRKLHDDGLPMQHESYIDKEFAWRVRDKHSYRALRLILDVPYNGTDHIEIIKNEVTKTYVDEQRRAVWHSRPYRRSNESAE